MYCNNCGCKISSGESRCPNCDTEIKDIEYNGGFWGLVGQVEKEEFVPEISTVESVKKEISIDIPSVSDKSYGANMREEKEIAAKVDTLESDKSSEEYKQNTKIKKKYERRLKILSCAVIILLLLCVIQTVRVTLALNRYRDLKDEYDIMDQDYQSLDSKCVDLNQKLDEMQDKLDDSSDKEAVAAEPLSDEENFVPEKSYFEMPLEDREAD